MSYFARATWIVQVPCAGLLVIAAVRQPQANVDLIPRAWGVLVQILANPFCLPVNFLHVAVGLSVLG